MFDFVRIDIRPKDAKNTKFEVYPEFLARRTKDLMIRGKAFYAVWNENTQLWTQDEYYISTVIDAEIRKVVEEMKEKYKHSEGVSIKGAYLSNFSSNKWTEWQKYVKSLPDNYHELDTTVTFANSEIKKTDYISKRLPYDLVDSDCPAYNELMDILYDPEERKKLEWAIGAIISGDSKHIQKFIVLYGPPKSGKSTFLKIVQKLFEGYYSTFEAKALGTTNNPFALEAFKDNPLLVIQHDGDLSKIEDNTKLNQIVSHEELIVNEKYKATYATSFNSFLMLGTNKPVKITDAKSGIVRRLIDVEPTGNTAGYSKYRQLMSQINFELGAIANHCLKLYSELGESCYDTYKPLKMIGATNVVYNFLEDNYFYLKDKDEASLADLWAGYVKFCEEGNQFKMSKTSLKEELRSYFKEFIPHTRNASNIYIGFRTEKFIKTDNDSDILVRPTLQFNKRRSDFDEWCKDMGFPAQYAKEDETPEKKWDEVTTTLEDIDTSRLHYVRVPEDLIVIDFDLKDETGNKSFEKNLEAASTWPPTYAELSKSGAGIHLHYIYDGNVRKLNNEYADGIEVKVFTGKSALRRKLTKCNDIPIATINSGLPLKEEKKMLDVQNVKDERHLRSLIFKNLKKEIHPGTKPSVDFIYKILEDTYKSGMKYDVSDLKPDILAFANNSTNHAQQCVNLVHKMHFCSEKEEEGIETVSRKQIKIDDEKPIIFYDVEVFPNLFLINWKYKGDTSIVRMINPSPTEVAGLFSKYRAIDFNGRRYDRHICYARIMGYSLIGLFDLSQRIISGDKAVFFREAYNLGYTDVYDFSNKKQSLKKWEIELGIHHQELGLAWDKPVPEEMWEKVAEYCDNDVIALEAVFDHLHEDWAARKILALLSGLTVNDTTNSHTAKIIVGDDKNPQDKFVYTDLSKKFPGYEFNPKGIDPSRYKEGTKIVTGKSLYLGEDPGEGGYVYAEPGIYRKIGLEDIASMHPTSARNLNIFGPYQPRYNALIDARLAIKHENYDDALKNLLIINPDVEKELKLYLSDAGETKALSYALKIPINMVYGMTSAPFMNRLKDPNNIDNIVAKCGALFMINLKHEVQKRGFKLIADSNIYVPNTVAHIKTDSIKIPNATEEIIEFVKEYGKKYGYTFEHEATYDRMCLVNDAVYIAKYDDGPHEFKLSTGEKLMTEWTATGAEFQHPYIFKTLFAKAPLNFNDFCETKSVQKGELYLDMNEDLPEGEHNLTFVGRVGSFVPIKPGCGGGILYRVQDGKNYAATGTKGYRWLEAEVVKNLHKEDDIDMSYFEKLAEGAIKDINEYGDFDRFVNDENYDPVLEKYLNVPEGENDEVPFEEGSFMNKPA